MVNDPELQSNTGELVSERLKLKPGQIISGRYEILAELGQGGMGLVFVVRQILIHKEFALKTLDKLSETSLRRFQQEARAMFSVEHPNLIAIKDFGLIANQTPFLIMELLKGENLADRLKRTGSLSVEDTLLIVEQVCLGLACAHDFGIIHRDVKPSNIFIVSGLPLGTEGSIKVLDFGIAKFTSHEEGEVQALTKTGEIFGSPPYMSPEQCSGSRVDQRSDVYSLGCVLFECLTGAPPFVGNSALETMMKRYSDRVPSLKEASLGREFPAQLELIVSKMLASSPENRYHNLGIVAQELSAVRRGDDTARAAAQAMPNKTFFDGFLKSSKIIHLAWLAVSIVAASIAAVVTHQIDMASPPVKPTDADEFAIAGANTPKVTIPDYDEETDKEFHNRLLTPTPKGSLVLDDLNLDDEKFKDIVATGWIEEVDIRHCTFSNRSLSHLQRSKIDRLIISSTNVDDSGAAEIAKCKTLSRLRLSDTKVTGIGILKLCTLPNLTTLDLTSSNVTDEAVAKIAQMPNLKWIVLNECPKLSSACLQYFANKKLIELQIRGMKLRSGDLAVIRRLPTLKHLDVSATSVNFADVAELCKNSPMLEDIKVQDCLNLSSEEIGKLKQMFPEIKFKFQS